MDLDESLEDMVAKDAQLQYILSPQAEEQVRPASLVHTAGDVLSAKHVAREEVLAWGKCPVHMPCNMDVEGLLQSCTRPRCSFCMSVLHSL